MKTIHLGWRFWLPCWGIILASTVGQATWHAFWQWRGKREQARDHIRELTALVAPALGASAADGANPLLQQQIDALGQISGKDLTVVGLDGEIWAQSLVTAHTESSSLIDQREFPEILEASTAIWGEDIRVPAGHDQRWQYVAHRIDRAGTATGFLRVGWPYSSATSIAPYQLTLGIGITFGGLAVWIVRRSVSRLLRTIARLETAATEIANGQFSANANTTPGEHFQALSESLHRIGTLLQQRQQQLQECALRYTTVLQGMVDGVIAVDAHQRVLVANHAAGRLLGIGASPTEGQPLIEFARVHTLNKAVSDTLQTRKLQKAEMALPAPGKRIVRMHATPMPGEPCPGVAIVLHDITELRRLETLRQEFVANVSHELKTPLSSIKANAETLLAGAIDDQANNRRFLQHIQDQSDRLDQLIHDMLSLARIETGDEVFDIGPIDLHSVVAAALPDHQPAAVAKNIELRRDAAPEPVIVLADAEGLRQILDNLVNNAIKYTPNEGIVTVRWRREEPYGVLEVEDTGIGISRSDQQRLFERFYRADKARSRDLGGTGLGLSIVKHLTQVFGGHVCVHSELGKGSTFTVQLPCASV